jgi:hypothetical protein
MKRFAAILVVLATQYSARADDTAMQLMQVMMRCPCMSADGKHIAIYSVAPGDDKPSRTSLAVFGESGKLEQRISVVPPAVDAKRAADDAAKITKVLDAGKYQRMARMASQGGVVDKKSYKTDLSAEDVVLALGIVDRKVTITGTRDGKKLAPIVLALPAKDGPCKTSDSFDVANTMAGYDKKSRRLAFEVTVTSGDTVCFAHDYVVTLK